MKSHAIHDELIIYIIYKKTIYSFKFASKRGYNINFINNFKDIQ